MKYPITADLSTPANFRMFKAYMKLTGSTEPNAARDLMMCGLNAKQTTAAPKPPPKAKKRPLAKD